MANINFTIPDADALRILKAMGYDGPLNAAALTFFKQKAGEMFRQRTTAYELANNISNLDIQ